MELSTSAKKIITELRCDYERLNRLADLEFLCTVFDIMACEDGFRDVLSYEVMDNSRSIASEECGRVFIDLSNSLKETFYLSNLYKTYFDKEYLIAVRNMFMLSIMFHEFTHISQEFGFSSYDEINKLFDCLYARSGTLKYKFMRMMKNDTMFDERHANAHSFRLLSDICSDSVLNQILGDIYFSMANKNIRYKYFEHCIKNLNIRHGDLTNLPLIERLDIGANLSLEEKMCVKELTKSIWANRNSFSESLNILRDNK